MYEGHSIDDGISSIFSSLNLALLLVSVVTAVIVPRMFPPAVLDVFAAWCSGTKIASGVLIVKEFSVLKSLHPLN